MIWLLVLFVVVAVVLPPSPVRTYLDVRRDKYLRMLDNVPSGSLLVLKEKEEDGCH